LKTSSQNKVELVSIPRCTFLINPIPVESADTT